MDKRSAIAIAAQTGIPVITWGEPGQGKTAFWEQLAVDLGVPIEVIIASIREPSDFSGMPVVRHDSSDYILAPPFWAKRMTEYAAENTNPGVRGIIFVDEITTVAPTVQAALLRVIKDGVVGEYALHPQVIRVAAANPPEQAAGGWHLAPPLANRFIHFDWKVTPQEWSEWNLTNFDHTFSLPIVPPNWKEDFLQPQRVLVSSFINARPTLFHNRPENENDAGRAWPSGRTWDYAQQLLAAAEAVNADRDTKLVLLQGAVGQAASEFVTWQEELDLPDPEKMLKNPEKDWFPKDNRPDKIFAILSGVVSCVLNDMSPKRWEAAWEILGQFAKKGRTDIAAFAAKTLAKNMKQGKDYKMPLEHVKEFIPMLKKAGIM